MTLTPLSGSASNVVAHVTGWTNNKITVDVTSNAAAAPTPGAYQLLVRNTGGKTSVNGLTFHVLGGSGSSAYNPTVIHVPSRPSTAPAVTNEINASSLPGAVVDGDPGLTPENIVQVAVDRAATVASRQALVVVWPKTPVTNNPQGEYYENLIVHSNVKIQGAGPGGVYVDSAGATQVIPGARLDGLGFNPDNNAGAAWVAEINQLATRSTDAAGNPTGITGPVTVPDAAVVSYAGRGSDFAPNGNAFRAALDGVTVTGGSQADFATAINEPLGGATTGGTATGALVTQGGGVYVHAAATGLSVTNNVIVGNSGSYAGAIRIGTPYDPTGASNGVKIQHNRIRDNGGTNLAGGVGIFSGSNAYSVTDNDLCGNFSAEYGGALTQYGLSTSTGSNQSEISRNRVYLNQSYDEGGGVMIAGELNPNLSQASAGAGTVKIDANLFQDNLANDDGGGLRFLSAGSGEMDVTNNMIVDNVSAHEGGGIALDDASNVHITGNTVMNNITTATAVTSNGDPAPAGISTANNSVQFTAAGGGPYSKPQNFRDNIIVGNLAGTWDPGLGIVTGIGADGDTTAKNIWDVGSVETLANKIQSSYSIFSKADPQLDTTAAGNQVGVTDPGVVAPYTVSAQIITSRTFPSFRQAVIVVNPVSPSVQGDYHLTTASVANGAGGSLVGGGQGTASGTPTVSTIVRTQMGHDIDGDTRPATIDVGADEHL